jgi:hypothetical protein
MNCPRCVISQIGDVPGFGRSASALQSQYGSRKAVSFTACWRKPSSLSRKYRCHVRKDGPEWAAFLSD